MAKISRQKQREVVREHYPGWKLVEQRESDAARAEPPAEAQSPDLQALRRKFLGRRAEAASAAEEADSAEASGGATDAADAADAEEEREEDTAITIAAENAYDQAIGAPGEKKVIISGKDGKPKLAQG